MPYIPRVSRDGYDIAGTTGTRPTKANHGTLRYNQTTQQLDAYDAVAGAWVTLATAFSPIASANQAIVTPTQDTLTDSSGGAASTTLAAITNPAANATTSLTADVLAIKNALASFAAENAKIKTDIAALVTLTTALRAALVTQNVIKGSA